MFNTWSSIHDILRKNPNFQDFWEFGTCVDSVYQALLSPHKREPGFEAKTQGVHTGNTKQAMNMYELTP